MFFKRQSFRKYIYLEFWIQLSLIFLSQEKGPWSEQQEESSSGRQKLKADFLKDCIRNGT